MASVITIRGLKSVKAAVRKYVTKLPAQKGKLAFIAAKQIERRVKVHLTGEYLNVGNQKHGRSSGRRLRSSFTVRHGKTGAWVGTDTVYAPPHEFGYENESQVYFRTNKQGERKYYQRHMKQKERKYFRDAAVKSERDQLRAMEIAFRKMVRHGN